MSDRITDPARGSGVEIPYKLDWIFPRLRNPNMLWYVTSQIVITVVGLFSKFVLSKYGGRLDTDLTQHLAERHVYFWPRESLALTVNLSD